jgi:hypothetical protein
LVLRRQSYAQDKSNGQPPIGGANKPGEKRKLKEKKETKSFQKRKKEKKEKKGKDYKINIKRREINANRSRKKLKIVRKEREEINK